MSEDRTVLVVDDDASIREFLEIVLADEGYRVLTAPNGAVALELVRQTRPQVILLDMLMPVVNGWEFAAAYRESPGPRAAVVVVTAAIDAADRAAEVEADDYLAKPFDLSQLLEVVRRYVA